MDLPVAVFGHSYEEAISALNDALISHFEALEEIGKLDGMVATLLKAAKDQRFVGERIPNNQPLVNLSIAVGNHQVYALG